MSLTFLIFAPILMEIFDPALPIILMWAVSKEREKKKTFGKISKAWEILYMLSFDFLPEKTKKEQDFMNRSFEVARPKVC